MEAYETVTNIYKQSFIDEIINKVEFLFDNNQLLELNKSLNHHTSNLIISEKPDNTDINYSKTNTNLINEFIKVKKLKGCTTSTIKYYNSQLKRLSEWSVKSFIEFNSDDIKEYLHFYESLNNCSKTTLNNTRRVLSSFWQWLELEEKIIINPMKRIPYIKVPKFVRKAFSDEEIELIRNAAIKTNNPLRNTAIVELLLSSGLRLNEITSLKINDISLSDCKGTVMGKGQKERIFYFSEKCKIALQEYINNRNDDKQWLFVGSVQPYNKFGSSGLGTMIRELGKACNIEKVHPHRFRRTLATRLVRKGMPIEQVSKILGHESLDVTMHYIETDNELLRLTHNKHTN